MTPGWVEQLVSAQIDGTAVTAAAATSCIPAAAKYTLPANYFSIGKQLEVEAFGRLSTVITTPGTLRLDLRLGGAVVFDSLAIALVTATAYTNVGWYFKALLTCRAIGAAANFFGQGIFTAPNILGGANVAMPIGGVVAMLPWNTAPAVGGNFDSTTSQQLDMQFTQTVATGSFTVHQYSVKAINQPS